jgi:hypothetical protein
MGVCAGQVDVLRHHVVEAKQRKGAVQFIDLDGAKRSDRGGKRGQVHLFIRDVIHGVVGLPRPFTDKTWVTANELEGNVHNRGLVLVVPGCWGGVDNRLQMATGAKLYVGNNQRTNAVNVGHALEWVIDYLNGDQEANEKYLSKNPGKNTIFP